VSPEVHYVAATAEGGIVQASSEAAADDQMRVRCPGGYEIERVDDVPAPDDGTPSKADRRFTYRCIVYRPAATLALDTSL
jgi:hypothetical protein